MEIIPAKTYLRVDGLMMRIVLMRILSYKTMEVTKVGELEFAIMDLIIHTM